MQCWWHICHLGFNCLSYWLYQTKYTHCPPPPKHKAHTYFISYILLYIEIMCESLNIWFAEVVQVSFSHCETFFMRYSYISGMIFRLKNCNLMEHLCPYCSTHLRTWGGYTGIDCSSKCVIHVVSLYIYGSLVPGTWAIERQTKSEKSFLDDKSMFVCVSKNTWWNNMYVDVPSCESVWIKDVLFYIVCAILPFKNHCNQFSPDIAKTFLQTIWLFSPFLYF